MSTLSCDLLSLCLPSVGESALELLRRRQRLKPIATHCAALDRILDGGVPIGQITEICGVPGGGKTQLCIQLACNVQTPKVLGGGWDDSEAIYIDTEGSFIAKRALSIAEGSINVLSEKASVRKVDLSLTPSILLSHIHVYRVFDHVEQLACIKTLPAFLRQHPNTRLLIIDSVAFHFRRGFTDLANRTRLLTGLAQELMQLANKFELAVVLTNQVTTRLGSSNPHSSSSSSLSAALAPALGESWAHSCTNRLMLDYQGSDRVARLLKSPHMKSQQLPYDITMHGIRDVRRGQTNAAGAGASTGTIPPSMPINVAQQQHQQPRHSPPPNMATMHHQHQHQHQPASMHTGGYGERRG